MSIRRERPEIGSSFAPARSELASGLKPAREGAIDVLPASVGALVVRNATPFPELNAVQIVAVPAKILVVAGWSNELGGFDGRRPGELVFTARLLPDGCSCRPIKAVETLVTSMVTMVNGRS